MGIKGMILAGILFLSALAIVYAEPPASNVVLYGNVFLKNGSPADEAVYSILVYDNDSHAFFSNQSGIVGAVVEGKIYESQNTPNSADDIFNVTVIYGNETGKWNHIITSAEFESTVVEMPDMTLEMLPLACDYEIEWLQPLAGGKARNVKSNVPIKFNITQNGVFSNDTTVHVYVYSPSGEEVFNATYGKGSHSVRIENEIYITNFKAGTTPGNYTVKVNFSNGCEFHTSFELTTPPVAQPSSGGGGRGVGASKSTVVKKINAGGTESATFELSDTGYVSEITITSKETVYNVKIVVETLQRKPYPDVPDPEGLVLSYLKLTKAGISNTQLEKAEVKFRVPVSWLTENDISHYRVYLRRDATNTWEPLETTCLSEDDEFAYYETVTPGFSYFVITGEGGSGYIQFEEAVTEAAPGETEPPVGTIVPTVPTAPDERVPQESVAAGISTEEDKKGICGPTIIVALALIPVLVRWRRGLF